MSRILLLVFVLLLTAVPARATSVETWSDTDVDVRAVQPCARAMGERVMVAVIDWENRGAPRPWTIGVNVSASEHYSYYFGDEGTAVRAAVFLVERGYTNIDVGIAQINSVHINVNNVAVVDLKQGEAVRNEGALAQALYDAFDPCYGARRGAEILRSCYDRALEEFHDRNIAMERSLRCYNSGTFSRSVGYGQEVWKIAAALPASIGGGERARP